MVLTGWASLLAVFAVEFLSLLYLGTLGEEAILAAGAGVDDVVHGDVGQHWRHRGRRGHGVARAGAGDGQGARRLAAPRSS